MIYLDKLLDNKLKFTSFKDDLNLYLLSSKHSVKDKLIILKLIKLTDTLLISIINKNKKETKNILIKIIHILKGLDDNFFDDLKELKEERFFLEKKYHITSEEYDIINKNLKIEEEYFKNIYKIYLDN